MSTKVSPAARDRPLAGMRLPALALGLATIASCASSSPIADGGVDVRDDAPALPPPTDQLDVLVVIESSGYTASSGSAVLDEMARAIRALATGDRDGDGIADFAPVHSMHVGLVDGDLGVGDAVSVLGPIVTVSCDASGRDGVLTSDEGLTDTPCVDPAGRVLVYDVDTAPDVERVVTGLACRFPTLSTRRCAYQGPLEAALKALSPAPTADGASPWPWTADGYRPPTFRDGTSGHGDDPSTNAGLLRPDSVLLMIVVAGVDDFSTPNPFVYQLDNPDFIDVPYAWRRYDVPGAVYPLDRYVSGLVGLRRYAGRFVYAVIAGVPVDLSGASLDSILADPRMGPMESATTPGVPADACADSASYALPARRFTELGRDVLNAGGHASAHSLCTDQVASFDRILDDTLDALRGR